MPNFNATLAAAGAAVPPSKVAANVNHGRVRLFESTHTQGALGAIGDTITWGDLPIGARVLGHLSQLNWSAGTAASTLNLGDAASAARHLAATGITAAGVAVPQAQSANGATFATEAASKTLVSTVAGAGLAAGQVLTLRVAYVLD